ncbi:MAG TPA: methyltransferase domain-containing protein [Acidimicrobiales bacterium]|nr:methyltransferase domain-containing protein [Acidimicrobiales bacterium]
MHLNSQLLFDRYVLPQLRSGQRVLEVGPDAVPSAYQRSSATALGSGTLDWSTADLASEVGADGRRRWGGGSAGQLTLVTDDPEAIPAPSDHFDVVVSGQVIEHVSRPWRWLPELARVCRPGGLVVTIAPVSWPYHEAPQDCWRIYPAGMAALAAEADLTVEVCRWESLEPRPPHWYPGRSNEPAPTRRQEWWRKAKAVAGWPLPVAFDTVLVARKPARPGSGGPSASEVSAAAPPPPPHGSGDR